MKLMAIMGRFLQPHLRMMRSAVSEVLQTHETLIIYSGAREATVQVVDELFIPEVSMSTNIDAYTTRSAITVTSPVRNGSPFTGRAVVCLRNSSTTPMTVAFDTTVTVQDTITQPMTLRGGETAVLTFHCTTYEGRSTGTFVIISSGFMPENASYPGTS